MAASPDHLQDLLDEARAELEAVTADRDLLRQQLNDEGLVHVKVTASPVDDDRVVIKSMDDPTLMYIGKTMWLWVSHLSLKGIKEYAG